MKKRIFSAVVICAVLVGAICLLNRIGVKETEVGEAFDGAVNEYPGVTLTVAEGSVQRGQVVITALNTTDKEIESGNEHDFGLQKEVNGVWYAVKPKEGEWANTAEALLFLKDEPVELTCNWAGRYGVLSDGHYRIVKSFFEYRGPGDYTDFLLAAEFTIGS